MNAGVMLVTEHYYPFTYESLRLAVVSHGRRRYGRRESRNSAHFFAL